MFTMLLVSSIRVFFGVSNKLVKTLLPNVRICRTNLVHKKSQPNLIANNSKPLLSLSSFSTISQQLNTFDTKTVQVRSYIPYTEKKISGEDIHSEGNQENKKFITKIFSSLNQDKSAENEPKGADEYTL